MRDATIHILGGKCIIRAVDIMFWSGKATPRSQTLLQTATSPALAKKKKIQRNQ